MGRFCARESAQRAEECAQAQAAEDTPRDCEVGVSVRQPRAEQRHGEPRDDEKQEQLGEAARRGAVLYLAASSSGSSTPACNARTTTSRHLLVAAHSSRLQPRTTTRKDAKNMMACASDVVSFEFSMTHQQTDDRPLL